MSSRASSRRARNPNARAEQQRRQRQRMLGALGAFAAVIAVVVVLVVAKSSQSPSTASSTPTTTTPAVVAPASVLASLAGIPPSALAAAARGGGATAPKPFDGPPPPGQAAKPEVFYFGAEFCPYCAAERWAVVIALSHFGQFASLDETHSASDDVDPDTPTFSFYGATYTSDYLAFSSVEEASNQRRGGGYAPLQTPTGDQASYVTRFGSGGIPFVALAGKYTVSTQYDPALLRGKTFDAVAAAALDSGSTIGKAIQASAGLLVADLCQITNGQPGAVCSAFSGAPGG